MEIMNDYRNSSINRVKVWESKRCLIPRSCCLSNKKLWGKKAYRGILWIHGPGDPIEEIYWIDEKEFLLWQLKRG